MYRLYYDVITGEVLLGTGNVKGTSRRKTIEEEIETYIVLSERNRNSFDVLEIDYKQYERDFAEASSFRINSETKQIEFSYPDPNESEVEQPYQVPLSEQIATNMDYLLDVDFRLIMIELGMN